MNRHERTFRDANGVATGFDLADGAAPVEKFARLEPCGHG
jgi:hypothetical protein